MDHQELVRGVDRLPHAAWTGEAFRHVSAGRSPLSGEGARIIGGRWNPPGSFAVLYLGTGRETAVAEFYRLAERQDIAPSSFLPRTVHHYSLTLTDLVDLRDDTALQEVGLTGADVRSDDLAACQRVGEAAFASGREGVIAASATGHGDAIALFISRLHPNSSISEQQLDLWEQPPSRPA